MRDLYVAALSAVGGGGAARERHQWKWHEGGAGSADAAMEELDRRALASRGTVEWVCPASGLERAGFTSLQQLDAPTLPRLTAAQSHDNYVSSCRLESNRIPASITSHLFPLAMATPQKNATRHDCNPWISPETDKSF
jgi:hypothetical protein